MLTLHGGMDKSAVLIGQKIRSPKMFIFTPALSNRPSDVLSTRRIFVEEGGSDPSVIDSEGLTALHLHTGTPEQFNYLLIQENFHIDLGQLGNGSTVAEYQLERTSSQPQIYQCWLLIGRS